MIHAASLILDDMPSMDDAHSDIKHDYSATGKKKKSSKNRREAPAVPSRRGGGGESKRR